MAKYWSCNLSLKGSSEILLEMYVLYEAALYRNGIRFAFFFFLFNLQQPDVLLGTVVVASLHPYCYESWVCTRKRLFKYAWAPLQTWQLTWLHRQAPVESVGLHVQENTEIRPQFQCPCSQTHRLWCVLLLSPREFRVVPPFCKLLSHFSAVTHSCTEPLSVC